MNHFPNELCTLGNFQNILAINRLSNLGIYVYFYEPYNFYFNFAAVTFQYLYNCIGHVGWVVPKQSSLTDYVIQHQ